LSDSIDTRIERLWYGQSRYRYMLLPFAGLFSLYVAIRRKLYQARIWKSLSVGVPVIVVGNITAGGTGKTPLTIWLARALQERGQAPGIVSRGYGGNVGQVPVLVSADSEAERVGDEAILLAAQSGCPVVVHPDRVAAARKVIEFGANIVIADDGLQHYRLARNFEIAVVDDARGFGNGAMLPAGPLREPVSRLQQVDQVLMQRHGNRSGGFIRRSAIRRPLDFRLRHRIVSRLDGSEVRPVGDFAGRRVHAVAAIGDPERFFRMLESLGLEICRHRLPDHAAIGPQDIDFDDDFDVLMTAKDAVKCRWLDTRKCWCVPLEVEFDDATAALLTERIFAKLQVERLVD